MTRTTTLEKIEHELLDLMGDEREVHVSRTQLVESTGVSLISVSRANRALIASGRWDIRRGTGRDTGSVYRLLED